MRVSVLLPLAMNQLYDYVSERPYRVGQFVRVPLRRKQVVGCVWRIDSPNKAALPLSRLRPITESIDVPLLNPSLREFIERVAAYTMAPRGMVLKLAMTPASVFRPIRKKTRSQLGEKIKNPNSDNSGKGLEFSEEQKKTIHIIRQAIEENRFQTLLLHGITGSGKTEICFDAIQTVIARGRQALFLLPEIALTDYIARRFEAYSGGRAVLWHSGLRDSERRARWFSVAEGKSSFIIGTRSALFLPFSKLGMIVVDEEHDEGFKQESGVVYHARDMAVLRGALGNFPVMLSSATPCLETLTNVERGRFLPMTLTQRARPFAKEPQIHLIDLRAQKRKSGQWITSTLAEEMTAALKRKEQILLFLNRRGYAPLMLCRHCGFRFTCPDCDSWLTEHRKENKLLCHYCGYHQESTAVCPQCRETGYIAACGPGVERLLEETRFLFPRARLACLSRDLPESLKERQEIFEAMRKGELDILIGTQIIAKGLDFPKLTLVGIIDADLSFANADLRAAERSFQLLQQVCGRAGRDRFVGRAFLQTAMPDHPVMAALIHNDRATFLGQERDRRKKGGWPPYGRLIALIFSGEDKEQLTAYTRQFAQAVPPVLSDQPIEYFGPAPSPIFRRKRHYHIRFLLKAARSVPLQAWLQGWLDGAPPRPAPIRCQIDVDPYHFL